ncbi:Fur family transcriptional regulator [Sinorhizobium sp. BG8]|uniref:Fur family transcriptional regulator n=1 Tax=Sinorhizobium sp. BG8 TaxID=2613773 RepID=UPI001AF07C84|nr:Fur family transcriptional regulator [Sinorhizobium sp. BG8]QRM56950.1 transcriptional repressor [Sinorhizobium sp. BG8]
MAEQQLTKNQGLVLGVLSHAEAPLSAYTILDKLRDDGMRAPLQVYRALDKLVDLGLVHRLESINAFVACAHQHEGCCSHGHGLTAFTICETCGKVTEFHDPVIEERLKNFARDSNFLSGKTTIEIRGHCSGCA